MKNKESALLNNLMLIDAQINDLRNGAETVFNLLKSYSNKISTIETVLEDYKAHFPFRWKVQTNHESRLQPGEQEHIDACVGSLMGYVTQEIWYLSWERDTQCKDKRFRLFIIAEETEYLIFTYLDDHVHREKFRSIVSYKKIFADANLATKLQFSGYISDFVCEFNAFLKIRIDDITNELFKL